MPYRLMCITAHPDDESGAFGGALLMAHAAGVETTVICLTEGQAASNRGEAADGEELARMRRAELAAAGEVLGLTRQEVLNYPDGQLASQDFSELVAILIDRIRRWRPQIVLTFGGEGGVNLHRDHTIASMAATAAFHWAGRAKIYPEQPGLPAHSPQKLYYSATPFLIAPDERERTRTCVTPHSLTLNLGEYADRKFEAFRKHASQAILLEKHRDIWQGIEHLEEYLLVAVRGIGGIESDESIFQGVVED